MRKILCLSFAFIFSSLIFALPNLRITKNDILIVPESEGQIVKDGNGFHLYVRKRGDIKSVLLTAPKDTSLEVREKVDNFYAYKGEKISKNEEDEKKYFENEMFISNIVEDKKSIFYLVSSTVEKNKTLGDCFHIYIPSNVTYGFLFKTRFKRTLEKGDKINIRTFSEKYANPESFSLDFETELEKTNKRDFLNNKTEKSFYDISVDGNGEFYKVSNKQSLNESLVDSVQNSINFSKKNETTELDESNQKVEIVFVIDSTKSMKDDFIELRKNWIPQLKKQLENSKNVKIGLLLYKDYYDSFNFNGLPVKKFGFAKSIEQFESWIKNAQVMGGEDEPEAVYEAIYAALQYFEWSSDTKKKIILVGDAEPHKETKKISKDDVISLAQEKNVVLDCILITTKELKDKDFDAVELKNASEKIIKAITDCPKS